MSASDVTPQQRSRAVILTTALMALHAALIAPAYQGASASQLLPLGAYCGALAGFIAAITIAATWHQRGARPGARLTDVFLTAWLTALWAAAVATGVAVLAAATGESEAQRTWGAALIGPGLGVLFGGRLSTRLLERLAARGPSSALAPSTARVQLALAGAAASGAFGGLHPWVRFPLGPPDARMAWGYGTVAVITVWLLLPFAGRRLMRSVTTSGAVAQTTPASGFAWLLVMIAVGAGLFASLTVLLPLPLWGWSLWRLVGGALLGASAISAGAALRR